MSKDYRFEPDTLQYSAVFSDGRRRIVPASSIARDATRMAIGAREQIRALSKRLVQGQIPLQEWYDGMQRTMKVSYYAGVSVARGREPSEPLRAAEVAFLLWLLTRQFNYLDEFTSEIEQGLPLDGSFVRRAGMYGMATKSIFENWRFWMARISGWREARRILSHADHCHNSKSRPGCVELADRGWMPIAEMTPLGDATCATNCACSIEYRQRIRLLAPSPAEYVSQFQAEKPGQQLIEVRDEHGHLLFKYDPARNIVEIKHKGRSKANIVDLTQYN